jgi:mRNA-degrading endonuclease RelE of RelBE toxin-antitoxin system
MEFRIADTFTESLVRLNNEEQKTVKTTAFDLQMNPANPGMQFHKIDQARDKNFWSVRVSRDIRLIVHKTKDSLLLCYVDHHDNAYHWAERRKLETHSKTGAAQLVVIRETVREVLVPKFVEQEQPKPALFSGLADDELLSYGVPPEWLKDVRQATEDSLLELAEHLPGEAAEALLNLAVGETPQPALPVAAETDPFDHPEAQRRFRVMNNVEELQRALDYPWEKWSVFLHPAQQHLVEQDFNGPARVSGSAGTGKTIVALHRAVHLARSHSNARVLLTTFSDTLSNALKTKLRVLINNEPRLAERVEVYSVNAIGLRLYKFNFAPPQTVSPERIKELIEEASANVDEHNFSMHFLKTEWDQVIDAWQLKSWEAYRDVNRLGRKTRLPESRRKVLWTIFEQVIAGLEEKNLLTFAGIFNRLALKFAGSKNSPFDYVVVDEAQDINVAQLKFLSALGGDRPNALFFAGDLGQRIFQQPFSWKSLGVDILGRFQTLKINYRTSHQIRMQADRLLGLELSDIDGNTEERRGTISVFNGPEPTIMVFDTPEKEIESISKWLSERISEDILPHEIGVFVRSAAELNRACAAAKNSGLPYKILDEQVEASSGFVSLSTMHLAKGLEFRAVVVMACDDEVIPLQKRIETVADDTDLEEVYNTERHLLYVACTRARDHLLVTSVDPASEFLDDLVM